MYIIEQILHCTLRSLFSACKQHDSQNIPIVRHLPYYHVVSISSNCFQSTKCHSSDPQILRKRKTISSPSKRGLLSRVKDKSALQLVFISKSTITLKLIANSDWFEANIRQCKSMKFQSGLSRVKCDLNVYAEKSKFKSVKKSF